MQSSLNYFLEPLTKLEPDTKPLWGKMTAQHMVEHLILSVKMSCGKFDVECFSPEEKLPVLKKILMSDRPLPRNFVNPIIGENLLSLEYDSLDKSKVILKAEIKNYYDYFVKYPDAVFTNPTFGKLNKLEWDVFHNKHFTHHLSQFGLMGQN